jgi:hypothetical protein
MIQLVRRNLSLLLLDTSGPCMFSYLFGVIFCCFLEENYLSADSCPGARPPTVTELGGSSKKYW